MRELQAVVISAIARVEVPGALWRKHRAGELTLEQLTPLVEEFEWDCYERFSMIAIDAPVLGTAALLEDPSALTEQQRGTLAFLAEVNSPLYRGYLLKKQLRAIYAPESRPHAARLLEAWLRLAVRSKLKPFVRLAKTLRQHKQGILNAIRLGLSNSRLEGLASRIRLISHRSFGFHSADPLMTLIYLCCGRIRVELPT